MQGRRAGGEKSNVNQAHAQQLTADYVNKRTRISPSADYVNKSARIHLTIINYNYVSTTFFKNISKSKSDAAAARKRN
jgi:hypothetical protein